MRHFRRKVRIHLSRFSSVDYSWRCEVTRQMVLGASVRKLAAALLGFARSVPERAVLAQRLGSVRKAPVWNGLPISTRQLCGRVRKRPGQSNSTEDVQ